MLANCYKPTNDVLTIICNLLHQESPKQGATVFTVRTLFCCTLTSLYDEKIMCKLLTTKVHKSQQLMNVSLILVNNDYTPCLKKQAKLFVL